MEQKIDSLIVELFEIEVLKFGNFKLKSSIYSPIYVDLRIIVSYPKLMDSLTDLLIDVIKTSCKEKYQHICGVPYTALPMATLVSSKTGTPMLIRRKEAKDHGTRKIIEGVFAEGDECIIIEDVVSSGSSIIETVEDLEKAGLKVSCAVIVLDREQGGIKNLQDKGIKVHVLTSLSKLLKILLKYEKITAQTVSDVEKYISENKIALKDRSKEAGNDTTKENISDIDFWENHKTGEHHMDCPEDEEYARCIATSSTKPCHKLRRRPGRISIVRKYCKSCYERIATQSGRAIARKMTKQVATFCDTCEGQPFLCLPCFNKIH